MSDFNPVPWLRSGVGQVPSEGGCIMQVIDWIHREGWTDNPPCVHPVLRALAIRANDLMDDTERQKLLDLAPRLMGTASDDKVLSVRLAVFCARHVLPLFEAKHPNDRRPRKAIEAAEAWCDEPTEVNRLKAIGARGVAAAAYADDAAAYAGSAAAYADDAAAHADDAVAYAGYAAAYAAYAAGDDHTLLVGVLDEYDRLTGRKNACPVDLTPAALAMAGK